MWMQWIWQIVQQKKAHRAVCTRKEVPCVYPTLSGKHITIVLHRGADNFFKCVWCGYAVRKDQNIKASGFSIMLSVWKSGPVRFFASASKDRDRDWSWYIHIVQKTELQLVRTGPAKDHGLGPVQTGLILYNILSSMVGVRLTNVWFSCKKPPCHS